MISRAFSIFLSIFVICYFSIPNSECKSSQEQDLTRARRGTFGQRYSGGLGSGSTHGVGYGGISSVSSGNDGGYGVPILYDSIALKAIAGPNTAFMNSYQANLNAGASSSQGLDYMQQNGQHAAAYAGLASNQAAQGYNTIATNFVPSGYKGEAAYKRK